MSCSGRLLTALVWLVSVVGSGALAQSAYAEGFSDDGGAEWRVEQPEPPAPPPGVESVHVPIGLGAIGDIEFQSPNRGALITSGNGSSIPAGVWLYNGERWRELATVCGASKGRIAWAGPDEFWTISNGRPGQALGPLGEAPPVIDDTLCHFAPGPSGTLEVVASYAAPAFLSTSYLPMDAAACLSPTDCWFGGEPLKSPQVGAFRLHWNGHALLPEPYLLEGHAIDDMHLFEGRLFESVRLRPSDRSTKELRPAPPLHVIDGEGGASAFEPIQGLPLYEVNEFPTALNYLHLGASETSLWAAAGPELETPEGSNPAHVTIARYSSVDCPPGGSGCTVEGSPSWSQVVGPESSPTGEAAFPNEIVTGIAGEPGTNSAWVALDTTADAALEEPLADEPARVARVSANGTVSDQIALPVDERHGPQGAGEQITCPAIHDCWLATSHGWLLHLSTAAEERLPRDTDPVFSSEEPISVRPPDEGLPQVVPDTIPADDSGVEEIEPLPKSVGRETVTESRFATVPVPLLSDVRSRLLHGTTLELSFHLAVRARVRLLAKRRASVVASTATQTLQAGNRSLRLRLNIKRWPTKLNLQTHALAPLPTRSTREAGTNSVSTGLVVLRHTPSFTGLEPLL